MKSSNNSDTKSQNGNAESYFLTSDDMKFVNDIGPKDSQNPKAEIYDFIFYEHQ